MTAASPPALRTRRAGDLLGLTPGAARLVDDEGLVVVRGVRVAPACAAVAAGLQERELTSATPPALSDAVPGTSSALPQAPPVSLTTKAWMWSEASA